MDIQKDVVRAAAVASLISLAVAVLVFFIPEAPGVGFLKADIKSGVSEFIRDVGEKISPNSWFSGESSEIIKDSSFGDSFVGAASPYEAKIEYEEMIIDVVDRSLPSVVSITVSKNVPVIERCPVSPFGDSGLQFYVPCESPSGKTEKKDIGGGSGFIVGSDGLIVTNKHVVSDKGAIYTVFMQDGKKYDGKVVALGDAQDIAIIKIEALGLKALKLGDSDSVRLGQTAIAIGNALGEYRNSVSVGVISGKDRVVTASGPSGEETIEGVFQTDAAINRGNSGGPLLNLKGEVIGINTATASQAENIGFTIPSNVARRAVDAFYKTGKIEAPYLGVWYEKTDEGAKVGGREDGPSVVAGSPAEKAGIKTGDIIIEADDRALDEVSLSSAIAKHAPGESIRLKIKRGEEIITKDVVLEVRK